MKRRDFAKGLLAIPVVGAALTGLAVQTKEERENPLHSLGQPTVEELHLYRLPSDTNLKFGTVAVGNRGTGSTRRVFEEKDHGEVWIIRDPTREEVLRIQERHDGQKP